MSENITQPTKTSVKRFIDSVEHDTRRSDAKKLLKMFKEITGEKPVLWGNSLIGFGQYHYRYDSGREGDMMMTGFSPRKSSLSVYVIGGFSELDDLLSKLGKHKIGKACLYINKLADVDEAVLRMLIEKAYSYMQEKYAS